ncbi:MAG TPA: hypothetical protein VF546_00695 [Pyrinomonadaceae bacterium]|jgi:hypothetical protein
MAETEQDLTPGAGVGEPQFDEPLAAPRFDALEARVAQPVVPLAEVRARRTRRWPLILLSALLGGVVSVCGLYLYQRQRANPPATQATTAPQPPPAERRATEDAPTENVAASASAEGATPTAVENAAATAPVEARQIEARAAVERAPARHEAVQRPERRETPPAPAPAKRSPAPARTSADETRPRRVGVIRDSTDAEQRAAPEPPPRRRPRPRNVDRIRDIFEGTRPPA